MTPVPQLYVSPAAAKGLLGDAAKLPAWRLDAVQQRELVLLLNGGYAPLRGYLGQQDHQAVRQGMRLASGAFWPHPVGLAVDAGFAARIEPGDDIALRDQADAVLAIMSVTDRWQDAEGRALLGGRVKGLPPAEVDPVSPNALRAWFADQAAVQAHPVPGGLMLGDVLVPLAPALDARAALLQAIVARNHGATRIVLPADAADLLRQHQDDLGIAPA